VQTADFGGEIARVPDGADTVQLGLQGLESFLVNRSFVHTGEVVVADLLCIGIARGGGRRGFLENIAENRPVALGELAESPP